MSNQSSKIIIFLVLLVAVSVMAAPSTHAMWVLNKSGELRYFSGEAVLGDTTEGPAADLGSDDFQFDESLLSELEKADAEVKNEEVKKSGLDKESVLRVEPKNGKLGVKSDTDETTATEIELDEAFLEIEAMEADAGLRIATGSGSSLVIIQKTTGAQTGLPLTLDTKTSEISVKTEQGSKKVTVLPDAAILKLKSDKVVDVVLGSSNTPKVEGVSTILSLEMRNNSLVYAVQGVKNKKVLWLFPVSIQKDLIVSAEDGSVVSSEIKSDDKIKDFFSF
jgi:hypothetical protein